MLYIIDSIPETTYRKPSTAQISEQLDENESFVYVGNKQIAIDYQVKEMNEVIPSHIGDEKNPDYSLKALQNYTVARLIYQFYNQEQQIYNLKIWVYLIICNLVHL